jgi:hypothetical protein
LSGRIAAHRVRGVGLELRTPEGRTRVLSTKEPNVTLTGAPGEIVLFLSGRKEAADVEYDGAPEAVALVIAAKLGI